MPKRGAAGGRRALVLGGGGAAGNAWLIGVVAGLHEGGLDVTEPDLIIGTSAGATAAAQLGGAAPGRLLAEILAAEPAAGGGPRPAGDRASAAGSIAPGAGTAAVSRSPAAQLDRTAAIIAAARDVGDMRRRMGAAALDLAAGSGDSWQQRWRATVAGRLPSPRWPRQPIALTAVDARTGEPVVFDRGSGVDLVDAVAASCAAGPAYAIGDGRYIDGGYRRSSENADLAAGYERVLVLSPLGGRTRLPPEWGMELAVQVTELRAAGSEVVTVLPDEASREAFGGDMMALTARAPAARAGYDQGRALAGGLIEFWR